MNFIGIDIGTSFIKGALLCLNDYEVLDLKRREVPSTRMISPTRIEADGDAFVQVVRDITEELLGNQHEVAGIVMCGQMGGAIVTDAGGSSVTPYISWQDQRPLENDSSGESYFENIQRSFADDWKTRMGNELRPGHTIPYTYVLYHSGQISDGQTPVSLPDYVAARLCSVTPVMEKTCATGCIDFTTGDWPYELLSELGLGDLRWPRIVDYRFEVGQYEGDTGQRIPVYAPVGDHQCALTGALLQDGELSINISTGSQVAMLTSNREIDDFQLRPGFDGDYFRAISHVPAGRALKHLVNLFSEMAVGQGINLPDPWAYALEQAESSLDAEVQVGLGFYPGRISYPGYINGLTESNMNIGAVFAAALQQMATHYEQFATQIYPNRDWSSVVFSGGLAQKSALLRQLILNRLGDSHRIVSTTDETLLGLTLIGRSISGLDSSVGKAIANYLASQDTN